METLHEFSATGQRSRPLNLWQRRSVSVKSRAEPKPNRRSARKWQAQRPSKSRPPKSANRDAFAASKVLGRARRHRRYCLRDCACFRSFSFSMVTVHCTGRVARSSIVAKRSSQSENRLEWSHLLALPNRTDGGVLRFCRKGPVITQREIYDGAAKNGNAVCSKHGHMGALHQYPHKRQTAKHGDQSIREVKAN
jgi:hypothetical protein